MSEREATVAGLSYSYFYVRGIVEWLRRFGSFRPDGDLTFHRASRYRPVGIPNDLNAHSGQPCKLVSSHAASLCGSQGRRPGIYSPSLA